MGFPNRTVMLLLLLLATEASACRERERVGSFPFEGPESVELALVEILEVDPDPAENHFRRTPPLEFTARVIEPFSAGLGAGEVIEGATGREDSAHAVCPVSLLRGKKYILYLDSADGFHVSRFSYRADEDDPLYDEYLRQLRGAAPRGAT